MPWEETSVMDQRVKFIAEYLNDSDTLSGLCSHYGISRKTGYKWIKRYEEFGISGLSDQSRRPHGHPHTTSLAIQERIIDTKLAHQSFGPQKVMDYLRREYPNGPWPADSTAGLILKRAGLVKEKKRRAKVSADGQPLKHCTEPNRVWSVDFKGHFALGNGKRCYPLTMSDNASRFVLCCRGLLRTRRADVQPWIEWVFREYGLPHAIRSDNGVPFSSLALGGVSELSKWWIKLGIKPERIEPGKPQQNGRHERMHRSLKAAALKPVKYSLRAQQQAFDVFVKEFNEQRSHQSLNRQTPSQVYQASTRAYPNRLPRIDYDEGYEVRRVKPGGEMSWHADLIYLSQVLAGEDVGLKAIDERYWEIYFSFYKLGMIDRHKGKVIPATQWHGRKTTNKV